MPWSSSNLARWGVLGAALAGAAWIAAAVIVLVSVITQGVVLVAYLFAWMGTLVGLLGLHSAQSPRQGWLGLTGFFAAFLGAGLALVGTLLTLVGSSEALALQGALDQALGLGLFIGLLGMILFGVGFVLWGVAILWAGSMPRWCGALMIAAMLVAWILVAASGGVGANVVLGLLWLALGYALWVSR